MEPQAESISDMCSHMTYSQIYDSSRSSNTRGSNVLSL